MKPADLTRRLKEAEAESTRLRLKLSKAQVCMDYYGSTRDPIFLELLAEKVK